MRALATALATAGHRVTLICGGVPTDRREDRNGYACLQLPAIKIADGDFTQLLQANDAPLSADFKRRRRQQLLQLVRAEAPQVLIIETFPFGRRALRFELLPLLQMVSRMTPRPLTFCSVRDILQLRSAARYRQTIAEVQAWFDAVLVHADPAVSTLADTFPLAAQLSAEVFHSGYLHSASRARQSSGGNNDNSNDNQSPAPIIVSAGGGAVGFQLLQTALAAKRVSRMQDRTWRILVGPNLPSAQYHELKNHADPHIIVQRNRADFAELLAACAVSISQAGYNTVLDAVAANCRSVLVPFARYGETEQTHRAQKMSQMGRAVVVPEPDLTPPQLAAAIERAANLDLSHCRTLKMDGAAASTAFIEECFARQQRAPTPCTP